MRQAVDGWRSEQAKNVHGFARNARAFGCEPYHQACGHGVQRDPRLLHHLIGQTDRDQMNATPQENCRYRARVYVWPGTIAGALAMLVGCRDSSTILQKPTTLPVSHAATSPATRIITAAPTSVAHVVDLGGPGMRSGGRPVVHLGPPHDTATTHAFTWDVASVQANLHDAGFASVMGAGVAQQPFMSVRGALLRVARADPARKPMPEAEIQVFVYGDQVARARDTDRLDPVRVAPPTTMVSWRVVPELIVDNNLAMIVLAADSAIRSRVRRAIAGGR